MEGKLGKPPRGGAGRAHLGSQEVPRLLMHAHQAVVGGRPCLLHRASCPGGGSCGLAGRGPGASPEAGCAAGACTARRPSRPPGLQSCVHGLGGATGGERPSSVSSELKGGSAGDWAGPCSCRRLAWLSSTLRDPTRGFRRRPVRVRLGLEALWVGSEWVLVRVFLGRVGAGLRVSRGGPDVRGRQALEGSRWVRTSPGRGSSGGRGVRTGEGCPDSP